MYSSTHPLTRATLLSFHRYFRSQGYGALVSRFMSHMLLIKAKNGDAYCAASADVLAAEGSTPSAGTSPAYYSDGILCKGRVRNVKIYAKGVSIWSNMPDPQDVKLVVSLEGTDQVTGAVLPFHQVGYTNKEETFVVDAKKKGYAFAVLVGTGHVYRVTFADGSR